MIVWKGHGGPSTDMSLVRSLLLTDAPDAALPDPNDIWQPDEVIDAVEVETHDDLPVPEHSFTYKQAVGTTDTYLGLDPMGKDPTSTSCEDLVLQVKLPEATSAGDINVDLKSDWVIVRTTEQYAPLLMPSTVEAGQPVLTWRCCILD
jgi:hypothetical protein